MMASKHISVAHEAGSATNLIGNGAQHAIAFAAAAFLRKRYQATPRGLYKEYFATLKALVAKLTACDHDMNATPPKRKFGASPG